MDKTCINCSEYKRCTDNNISWIFFLIGIIATIAIRVVIPLMHLSPLYGKIAWYTGVGGFLIFFIYKYNISKTRVDIIEKKDLLNKLDGKKALKPEDQAEIRAMLCALSSKKESINFFLIFLFSAIALALAIYFDFIR